MVRHNCLWKLDEFDDIRSVRYECLLTPIARYSDSLHIHFFFAESIASWMRDLVERHLMKDNAVVHALKWKPSRDICFFNVTLAVCCCFYQERRLPLCRQVVEEWLNSDVPQLEFVTKVEKMLRTFVMIVGDNLLNSAFQWDTIRRRVVPVEFAFISMLCFYFYAVLNLILYGIGVVLYNLDESMPLCEKSDKLRTFRVGLCSELGSVDTMTYKTLWEYAVSFVK